MRTPVSLKYHKIAESIRDIVLKLDKFWNAAIACGSHCLWQPQNNLTSVLCRNQRLDSRLWTLTKVTIVKKPGQYSIIDSHIARNITIVYLLTCHMHFFLEGNAHFSQLHPLGFTGAFHPFIATPTGSENHCIYYKANQLSSS